MMELFKRLHAAIACEDVRVGLLSPPLMVIATWLDTETGKAKFATVRVDEGFFEDTAAHENFIADFAARVKEYRKQL